MNLNDLNEALELSQGGWRHYVHALRNEMKYDWKKH